MKSGGTAFWTILGGRKAPNKGKSGKRFYRRNYAKMLSEEINPVKGGKAAEFTASPSDLRGSNSSETEVGGSDQTPENKPTLLPKPLVGGKDPING